MTPPRETMSDHRYHKVPQWHWRLLVEAERQAYERRWYRRLWRCAGRIARRITG